MKNISIALDGPAGAGKSTIAKRIAKIKNFTYIDTGAMYRAIALKFINSNIDIEDGIKIKKVLEDTKLNLNEENIYLDDKCVSEDIRTPKVTQFVSYVAKLPIVREKMLIMQREIAKNKNVIMDGRDIGTHVLPKATYKFFLTASVEERAHRRFIELKNKGFEITLEKVEEDIKKRDEMDTQREIAPLKKAEDATIIDTTGKTIDEVIEIILKFLS